MLEKILKSHPQLLLIMHDIAKAGGRALLVGGAVRDIIMERESKDFDIEVYNVSLEQLHTILQKFGPVNTIGKAFGVLQLSSLAIDWSVPRSDAVGRKPQVTISPHMAFTDAFRRRDLTMNAIGMDLITGEIIDPFSGIDDIKKKVLRAPSIERFVEDPLRLFRVMQFIGRFDMKPDDELSRACATVVVSSVSRERIIMEFQKLFLKSRFPSSGIRWLCSIGRLQEILPELYATIGVQQRSDYHPEGDVFEHSMQALDAAVDVSSFYTSNEQKLVLIYAALCHDLGKPTTTILKDDIWRSPGHAQAGVQSAQDLMHRIENNKDMICKVKKLVKHHMAPGELINSNARPHCYKRLAAKLHPDLNLQTLSDLARCDRRGRNGAGHKPLLQDDPGITIFEQRAQEAEVFYGAEKPILSGIDLIPYVTSGPEIGRLLQNAYKKQIEQGIQSKKKLLESILKNSVTHGAGE